MQPLSQPGAQLGNQARARPDQARGCPIRDTDFTDERLADLLDAVGRDAVGEALEEQLGQHLLRAYALPTDTARIDTTTVSVYHQPDQTTILDHGHSKDHRPELHQFKEILSTLDPVGLPLCSATVAEHCADDPLYLPIWQRMVKVMVAPTFWWSGTVNWPAWRTGPRFRLAAVTPWRRCHDRRHARRPVPLGARPARAAECHCLAGGSRAGRPGL